MKLVILLINIANWNPSITSIDTYLSIYIYIYMYIYTYQIIIYDYWYGEDNHLLEYLFIDRINRLDKGDPWPKFWASRTHPGWHVSAHPSRCHPAEKDQIPDVKFLGGKKLWVFHPGEHKVSMKNPMKDHHKVSINEDTPSHHPF